MSRRLATYPFTEGRSRRSVTTASAWRHEPSECTIRNWIGSVTSVSWRRAASSCVTGLRLPLDAQSGRYGPTDDVFGPSSIDRGAFVLRGSRDKVEEFWTRE